jgi:F-type H+-transporting ATPase subunit b
MRLDWWTLGLQTVNALVLIWLLGRFLFRPIADIIAQRKADATRLLDDAAAARAAALAEEEKAKAALADIEGGRAKALESALAQAQAQKEALLDAARVEAEQMRANAKAEMARAAKQDVEARMAHAGQLAVDIAKRLIERLPQADTVGGFIDALARSAAALPKTQADANESEEPATLTAPRALTEQEAERCRHALEAAFGRPLALAVAVDPSLIAGLELETRHVSIDNSLRADLARITAELAKRDADDVV